MSKDVYPLRTTGAIAIVTKTDIQQNADFMCRCMKLLVEFDKHNTEADFDAANMLKKLAELLEEATEIFIKNDPDPLDDRHPHRTHPDSALGNVLKLIFRNDPFMTKLVVSYILARDNQELNIQGSRVLLACLPGLDSKVVFSDPDDFIPRLYTWAQDSTNETLQAYAMGLLAGALENGDNASRFRNENCVQVPIALDRLRVLRKRMEEEPAEEPQTASTDFSQLSNGQGTSAEETNGSTVSIQVNGGVVVANGDPLSISPIQPPPPKKRRTEPCLTALLRADPAPRVPSYQNLRNLDDSNSKWDILQPFLIGTQQVYPLSMPTYQRYILQYLAACGEYQDLLLQVFEGNALDILLEYIDLEKTKDVRLTFDALKYLTSLLVHRKFALEFMERDGLPRLLKLPRTSLASAGVITCFYYIAYSVDVLEAICQMPEETIDETVQYVLWCLEHSYESGMTSACMFFSQALFYKAILKRFDEYDGPRKLYNYIATLTIMQNDENAELTEEQMHTSSQAVRSVCITARSYLTAHIFLRCEQYKKTYGPTLPTGMTIPEVIQVDFPEYKSLKEWEESAWQAELVVLEMLRLTGGSFKEAEYFKKLGMVRVFLGVRIISKEWTNIGMQSTLRNEICVHALDSLSVMLCQPTIQPDLLIEQAFLTCTQDGISILLETTQGLHDEDASLRTAALGCIQKVIVVHQDCWKVLEHLIRTGKPIKFDYTPKYHNNKLLTTKHTSAIMDHLERMWSAVRKRDGIIYITKLINCKTPITEADQIRKQAATAMAGLARHPEVRQILSKLPLIAQGQLQLLMREPVCSNKRDKHAAFCKEALLLLQIVSGKKMHLHQRDITVHGLQERHNHDWIMENTRVTYNETELLQLIHEHLVKKGLNSVAAMLKTEAKLPDQPASRTADSPIRGKPFPSIGNNFTKIDDTYPTLAPRVLESAIGGISARRPSQSTFSSPKTSRSLSNDDDVFATPTLPRRFTHSSGSGGSGAGSGAGSAFPKKLTISPARGKQRPSSAGDSTGGPPASCDLNDMVVEHFKLQHSKCKHPVTTVPPFSLFYPHQCPERVQKTFSIPNLTSRILDYDIYRPNERIVSQWANERNVFSRFKTVKTTADHDESYTQAAFSVDDEHLIVGFFSGELHWHNVDTGADDGHTNCHGSAITHIEPSKDGNLLLTSSAYVRPLSALWRLGERLDRLHIYKEDTAVRFANTSQHRIVGTNGRTATVYDTETNIVVDTYASRSSGLMYKRNFASFSPDDKLIFNDGMLWDVRQKNAPIHMFDRLHPSTHFGSFHPHRNQLIINSEVYDIRKFSVLYYVPEISQCLMKFNSTGNIMYTSEISEMTRQDFPEQIYASFRSWDTADYTALTTYEGKRPVLDICSSNHDQKLCVIEQCRPMMSNYVVQSSTQIKMIEVGRSKEQDDEQDEDDEEDQEQEREQNIESDESDDEEDRDAMEDPYDENVFQALGRLEDNDGSISSGSSGEDMDFRDVIGEMIEERNRRGHNRPRFAINIDGDEPGNDEENGENEGGDEDSSESVDLNQEVDGDEDSDFDMEAAIDDLVDGVDSELDEDELEDNNSGSWRTASQVGSDDINLDDLDEDAAREAEDEGEEVAEAVESSSSSDSEAPVPVPPPARRRRRGGLRGLAAVERHINDLQRHMNRRGAIRPPDALSARVEEQRAQFMDAIDRLEEQRQENEAAAQEPDPEDHFLSDDDEEEINSVSTIALNPTLRRQNRKRED